MISKTWFHCCVLVALAAVGLSPALAQQPAYPQPYPQPRPNYGPASPPRPAAQPQRTQQRVAERTTSVPDPSRIYLDRRPNEHPLMPALRWAHAGLKQIDRDIQDYTCTVYKRERQTDGKLGAEEKLLCKIRHKPFSVYMRFLAPDKLNGQEVIYVQGANEGKLLAHGAGMLAVFGTQRLAPRSPLAMKGQHYPITDMGVRNLIARLIEVGTEDSRYGECEVKFLQGAKINDRVCTCIEVMHPVPRSNFRFHLARIYVDNQLNVPTRYESYSWPKTKGGPPELIEEYTYVDIKKNQGLTDQDFDIRNPNYGFKEGKK